MSARAGSGRPRGGAWSAGVSDRVLAGVAGLAAAATVAACGAPAPLPALARAAEAAGAQAISSLRVEASGWAYDLGYGRTPEAPPPRIALRSFVAELDYGAGALRIETVRAASDPKVGLGTPGDSAAPLVQLAAGGAAWDDDGGVVVPQPDAAAHRALQLHLLAPHGFLRFALAAAEVAVRSRPGAAAVVEYTALDAYRLVGTVGVDGFLARVDTVIDHPVLGDTPVSTTYEEWRLFGDVRFPARIRQWQGGEPVLDLVVRAVVADAPVRVAVPPRADVQRAPIEEIADGVHLVTGGSHHSAVVEFGDHVAVVDAPLGERRAEAVIAAIRGALPGRAIRYVINTHHHRDHAAGLRRFAAEGALVVTHERNRAFYERAWAAPRTVRPDVLARQPREVEFVAVDDWHEFTDGLRLVAVHHVEGSPHADGLLMVWVPDVGTVIEADAFVPGRPRRGPPSAPDAAAVNLLDNLEGIGLDARLIVSLHGASAPATIEDLRAAAGRPVRPRGRPAPRRP